MICHILIVHVLSHYIVNSKGCRCVPARRRYFSGKMSLKIRADAAIWAVYAGVMKRLGRQALHGLYIRQIGRIGSFQQSAPN